MSTPKTVTASQIIADLDAGLDRKQIATKHGLTPSETKIMFQTSALTGKRTKRANRVSFNFVDDVTTPGTQTTVLEANSEIPESIAAAAEAEPEAEPEAAPVAAEEVAATPGASPFDRA